MKNDAKSHRKMLTPFGDRLKELMDKHGENYERVYELLRPEMKNYTPDDIKENSNNCLKRIRGRMTGKVTPNLRELELLADHYGVSIDYLVGRNDVQTGLCSDAAETVRDLKKEDTLVQFTQLERLLMNENLKSFLTQISYLYLENTIIREISNRGSIEDGEYIHFEKERAARYSTQNEFELILLELYPLTRAPEQKS